jgi:two-component system, chemotaxis family, protein-glutamate methylesterase/glutaminase
MPSSRPIRVVVVDDSAIVRRLVSESLNADPDIEVVGTAADPFIARDRIRDLSPDVITLDLEMPRMDGLTFLGIIMKERPLPVIIMSSLTKEGSSHALEALRLGAVEVLAKPNGAYSFGDLGPQLQHAVKAAAVARLRPAGAPARLPSAQKPPLARIPYYGDPRRLILLGASTGGTEALREVLTKLPDGLPPIAIVQHIPAYFSKAFADRLNDQCAFDVREATDGETLTPGTALIAPGNFHLLVRWTGTHYRAELNSGPPVWHQRPAVDVLFKSVPEAHCPQMIAGVLTGMGKDGAAGLARLRKAGATTFAQDQATSIVYGMPREAWEQGGAEVQLPLHAVAAHLQSLSTKPRLSHAPR